MINKVEFRSQFPQGYLKKIAAKANVNPKAVSEYFSGKTKSDRVERAALEILAQIVKEKSKLLKAADYE